MFLLNCRQIGLFRRRAGERLLWIAHGFSALGLSDHEILDREFVLYHALFGGAKGVLAAQR
jgi:hypothetical protein